MYIVKIKNNKVIDESNIAVKDNILPQFKIDEGWVEMDVQEPTLDEHETKGAVTYDLSGTKPIKTWKKKNRNSIIDYRKEKLKRLKQESFTKRGEIIADYKISNILIGVTYTGITKEKILTLIQSFRSIYKTAETEIKSASTHKEITNIASNIVWPTTI